MRNTRAAMDTDIVRWLKGEGVFRGRVVYVRTWRPRREEERRSGGNGCRVASEGERTFSRMSCASRRI